MAIVFRRMFKYFRSVRRAAELASKLGGVSILQGAACTSWRSIDPPTIEEALNDLDPTNREILVMWSNGESFKNIARDLGVTVSTARKKKQRAIEYFGDKLLHRICRVQ
jgi:DNA-binding CsgD family transcriptional regulator